MRPPAASINSPSSVNTSWLGPSRPGSGKCLGMYKTPWFAKSKGLPTSSICTFAGSTSPSESSALISSLTKKPMLFAMASKPLPTVSVAEVAITGVCVNIFSRNTSETESGAKYKVEKVGSYHSTKPSPIFNRVVAVVAISETAPLTRARSANASVSIISSSADKNCTIALEASITLRIENSSDCGISSKRPCEEKSPFTSSP